MNEDDDITKILLCVDVGIILGLREHGLYKLTGKPMDNEKRVEVPENQV